MRSLSAAFALLTRMPVPAPVAPSPAASGWFATVGLALGATAAAPLWLLLRTGWDGRGALAIAVVVVGWWAWATRMLHWDGLGDCADGAWGSHEHDRRLDIMADSHIGAFGVTAIVLVALAQVAGVAASLEAGRVWPLLLAPTLGRVSASLLVWGHRPVRAGGLGATLAGRPPAGAILATAAAATVAVAAVGLDCTCAMPAAAFSALAFTIVTPFLVSRPFGGYTGDVLGATVLLVEAVVLVLGGVI